ncbi:hypothetical protein [Roseobacter ponti]|uniref:Uncharacterized protein n=1 Tax=Roseobacter ponti TaxID=1891787 RepID=A0A858STF1_9RHOB|nr:hypothetical protein [Roseobacter ponti]QJF51072.1 hypothetical protein G3256_07820 [Roseobacter ponti]
MVCLPAAFVVAACRFYGRVRLKMQLPDVATVAVARGRLSELQDLRAEIFIQQAVGADAGIAGLLEARASCRDRLVQESRRYRVALPGYFTDRETLLPAEEQHLSGRPVEALEVVTALNAEGLVQLADMARFRGSLPGAQGPAQDLEAAREAFKNARGHGENLASEAGRQQIRAKETCSQLFMGLSENIGCDWSAPFADVLKDLLENDPDACNLRVLDGDARMMPTTFEAHCS